jgi:hypothetical protein
VPNNSSLDSSSQAGRIGGIVPLQIRSAVLQAGITSNALSIRRADIARSGRVRFHDNQDQDVTTPGVSADFFAGAFGSAVRKAGGFRIEFDWMAETLTGSEWVGVSAGFPSTATGEPAFRMTSGGTDAGFLLRYNGGADVFHQGSNVFELNPPAVLPYVPYQARHYSIDYVFSSVSDGSPASMTARIDGKVMYSGNLVWTGNLNELYLEIESNTPVSTLVDNVVLTSLPIEVAWRPMSATGLQTGFQQAQLGSSVFEPATSTSELGWYASRAVVAEAGNRTPPLTGPVVGGTAGVKALVVNNAAINSRSETIYLDGFLDPTAFVDVRTYTTSSSNFETDDFLRILIEVSSDGKFWSNGPDLLPLRSGSPDTLIALNTSSPSSYFRFSSSPGAIGPAVRFVRFAIEGSNDSPAEFFVIDNMRITASPPSDSDSDGFNSDVEWWFGSSHLSGTSTPFMTLLVAPDGLHLEFSSARGFNYCLEGSSNLVSWNLISDLVGTGPTTKSIVLLPSGGAVRSYYRVRRP